MKKLLIVAIFAISFINLFSKEILIATDGGRYKTALTKDLKKEFNKKGYDVKTISNKKILKEKSENYDLIVILATVKANKVNKRIQKFHNRNSAAKNIITYVTSGNKKWKSKEKYDLIAGASDIKGVSVVSSKIIEMSKSILK